ncbi:MAG: hypothetical protein ABIA77_05285 [Candidatus Omnitrophota bacterium]
MSGRNKAKCPECGEMVELDPYSDIGDIVACHGCDADLEVIMLQPPKLRAIRPEGPLGQDDYLDELGDEPEDELGDVPEDEPERDE